MYLNIIFLEIIEFQLVVSMAKPDDTIVSKPAE
jgi:hypothetical protein